MLLVAGSVVLACIQLASTWLLGRKARAGWVLSVTANLVAVPYDSATSQFGFVAVSVINLAISVRAWIAWGHPGHVES